MQRARYQRYSAESKPGSGTTAQLTFPAKSAWQSSAISVPARIGSNGLPIGLQIVGRHFSEPLLLDLALMMERNQPWPAHGSCSHPLIVRSKRKRESSGVSLVYGDRPMKIALTVNDFLRRGELVYPDPLCDSSTSLISRAAGWGAQSTTVRWPGERGRWRRGLDELGIDVGERVAMVSHNSARLLTAFFRRVRVRSRFGPDQFSSRRC